MTDAQGNQASGRILHAQLHLLDRQIIDHRSGRMVAKVDDVEIDFSGDQPTVTALLTGPAAWGPRLPGLLGRFVTAVHRRLHHDADPAPNVIDMAHVVEIGSAVEVDDADLGTKALDVWVRDQFISRIPGAGHATE
jgi:sporulation protein YlmC with PRC-barrel domain